MEVPELVADRLGDEEILAGVNLGDDDAVCLTETRTLVYRGEGLLSDESVTVLPHDVERLDLSEGRRKTTFRLTYVDREESVTVPGNRDERVLELLLEGILGAAEVTDSDESVHGVYRFSELTLIVTDRRLVKHIGAHVWDEDYEEFPFADVTGLAFEEGRVATQIVLSVDGRPQRIKAPNDEAPLLRRTLQDALFAFHDVDSVAELNEAVGEEPDTPDTDRSSDLTFDTDIDPLVTGPDSDSRRDDTPADDPQRTAASAPGETNTSSSAGEDAAGSVPDSTDSADADAESSAAVASQLDALTDVVKRQNQLLRKQHKTLEQLIEELKQGR